jgi:hypothetical protein
MRQAVILQDDAGFLVGKEPADGRGHSHTAALVQWAVAPFQVTRPVDGALEQLANRLHLGLLALHPLAGPVAGEIKPLGF